MTVSVHSISHLNYFRNLNLPKNLRALQPIYTYFLEDMNEVTNNLETFRKHVSYRKIRIYKGRSEYDGNQVIRGKR